MKLADVKRVKVGDREFPVKLTIRAMIDYESLSGDSILNLEGTEKSMKFFYCTAKAGARSEGKEFMTYDQFIDAIDDDFAEAVTNFSQALFEAGGDTKKKPKVLK
jgi:hypothetical protein